MDNSPRITKDDLDRVFAKYFSYDEHRAHHDFIEQMIEKEKRRIERWETVKRQVIGWAIIAMLAALGKAGYHLWDWAIQHVRVK